MNRLPIIRKRESKRKKISAFEIKHPSPLAMQKGYNQALTERRIEHKEMNTGSRGPMLRAEKADIRGWDIP